MKLGKVLEFVQFQIQRRVRGYDAPGAPHFDPATLDAFTRLLGLSRSYLEYGSGGSTVMADRAGVPAFSVEADAIYAKTVQGALSPGTAVRMQAIDIGVIGPWSRPVFRNPTPSRRRRWRRYVDAPFADASRHYDFVLVDGRFRIACALESVRQAQRAGKPCTVLLDDYTHRPYYHRIEDILGKPEIVGRAAIFRSSDTRQAIDPAEVAQAAADFR